MTETKIGDAARVILAAANPALLKLHAGEWIAVNVESGKLIFGGSVVEVMKAGMPGRTFVARIDEGGNVVAAYRVRRND